MQGYAVVLSGALLLGCSGALHAQTAAAQRKTEARLALARLARGVRLAESIDVLARAPLEEPLRGLRAAGKFLRRLQLRPLFPGDEKRSGKEAGKRINGSRWPKPTRGPLGWPRLLAEGPLGTPRGSA